MSALPDARGRCSEKSNNQPPSASAQRERILKLFVDARGGWVPLPEVTVQAVRHSWFRLAAPPRPMIPAAGGIMPETLPLFGNEAR